MFNKLVISAAERRKGRSTRFFCGTAVFYMLSVAASFAVSIILSNPNLADTSAHSVLMIAPPLPEVSGPPRPVATHPQSQSPPRADLRNVRDLAQVVAVDPTLIRRPNADIGLPSLRDSNFDADSGGGAGGGEHVPGLSLNIPGNGGHGDATTPPKPPDPPKQQPQAKLDDNRPVRVASVVLQGKAIVRHTPDYPALAKQIRLEGSVSVEVIISADGRVESARAISGHELFKATAEKAAEMWRFGPTFLNGTAVRVTGVIVFNFKLQ